ncbi:MAG TPA: class I SAM-dependent rRNA methyltransferase [Methylomirabilota bacterium]|nr:class I SAM-dependent rRNA methyltransferase [Methylomirabilota bacterium]
MATLVLKRGAERRVRAGHPWIYRAQVADLKGSWSAVAAVDVVDSAGRYLGRGFYNPRTSLACRLVTRAQEDVDAGLFLRRLEAALTWRRQAGLTAQAYRLCWSEADGLPGLVVDRYGPVSVIQCLTLGMAKAVPWVLEALDRLFPGEPLYRLDDPTAARIEGYEGYRGWIPSPAGGDQGEGPEEVLVAEGQCRFAVAVGQGQKTGLYLDQRENRQLVAAQAAGRRVLDAFSYAGGFACHALAAGARQALLIDSSADALTLARRNLELNALADRGALREGNAFDVLRELEAAHERFGLVVLDPPPFTRRKEAVEAAARGYKEINLRGLRLLEPGGVLATFSCSHHVTPALFEEICREAAGDAGIPVRVLATLTQSRDHPVLLNVPETRYLTGLLLSAV